MPESELNGFTCFILTYGDHAELVHRCLGSMLDRVDLNLVKSIRVGLNAPSERTRRVVYDLLQHPSFPADTLVYDSDVNRLKYPLMRKMFYDPLHPILTPYTMWFDDDSCLAPDTQAAWWTDVYRRMGEAVMLGSVWRMRWQGHQWEGVQRQPWFGGQVQREKITFATGGWWTARTRTLKQWDYPFKDITHNGGDVMLGEMLYQQKLSLVNYANGLWINADDMGNNSKAPRRGETRRPVWYDAGPAAHTHHDFTIDAVDPRRVAWAEAVKEALPEGPVIDMRSIRPGGQPLPTRSGIIKLPGF